MDVHELASMRLIGCHEEEVLGCGCASRGLGVAAAVASRYSLSRVGRYGTLSEAHGKNMHDAYHMRQPDGLEPAPF